MANILIIDDDPDMVLATRLCLESAGHKVDSAGDPAEGLKRIKASKPDLIVLDVMMPEMDGLELTRALRRDPSLHDLPGIAPTAKAMRDDYEECLAAGCNDYMARPIDVDKLISLCRVWIAR